MLNKSETIIEELSKVRNTVTKHEENIKKLAEEIAEEKETYKKKHDHYSDLITCGENEKADNEFGKLENMQKAIRAKESRLNIMKKSRQDVIIKNSKVSREKTEELTDALREENSHLISEYRALEQQLEEKKKEMLAVNAKWNAVNNTMSKFFDGKRREHDINPVSLAGQPNISPLYAKGVIE